MPFRRAAGTPPWSAFPASLEAECRAFVERGGGDDFFDDDARRPLRPATRENYLGALRRSAGELVASGISADRLIGLADLCQPARVKIVLTRVLARTGRKKGGHVALLAIVFYLAARFAGLPPADLAELKKIEKAVRGERQMGDRTLHRLDKLDDAHLSQLVKLPDVLLRLSRQSGTIDPAAARLVRAALFLTLLFDIGARQGNIVALNLDSEILESPDGQMLVHITGDKVKNGQEIRAVLPARTCQLLRYYRDTYRGLHAAGTTTAWLFPVESGKHWSTTAANQTLQDLTSRHIGMAVNPHLVRAAIALVIEQAHPGSVGLVKDILGHRDSKTTETYYRRLQPQRSRTVYHEALASQRGRPR